MVTHIHCDNAVEVDKFLNSNYVEIVAITSNAYRDSEGSVVTTYTIFYKI